LTAQAGRALLLAIAAGQLELVRRHGQHPFPPVGLNRRPLGRPLAEIPAALIGPGDLLAAIEEEKVRQLVEGLAVLAQGCSVSMQRYEVLAASPSSRLQPVFAGFPGLSSLAGETGVWDRCLVALLVFKIRGGSARALGGFDSHSPPPFF